MRADEVCVLCAAVAAVCGNAGLALLLMCVAYIFARWGAAWHR